MAREISLLSFSRIIDDDDDDDNVVNEEKIGVQVYVKNYAHWREYF